LEAPAAEWTKLKRAGDFAIQRWLEQQLKGRSCTVVLIGGDTASRPWVLYEIKRSWELGLGLFGVRVHQLNDASGQPGVAGANPFEQPKAGLGELGPSVPVFEPEASDSKLAYRYIVDHLAQWAEQALARPQPKS
jgi:hypothetical protein